MFFNRVIPGQRDVYVAYRKAGYSKGFPAEHETDILLHKAAKNAIDELGIKKLPTVKNLQEEYAQILEKRFVATWIAINIACRYTILIEKGY